MLHSHIDPAVPGDGIPTPKSYFPWSVVWPMGPCATLCSLEAHAHAHAHTHAPLDCGELQYLHLAGFDLPAPTALHIFVATGLSEAMLRRGLREPVETLLGAAAMGAVGWHSQTPYLGWVASALMVVAGIVVGPSHTRKTLFIWNIDLFHLLLAAAMTVVRLDLTKGMLFGFQ
jgi:hypothetical protein